MADIQSVKEIIRSILISTANGLSVDNIQKDYYDVEGSSIPFKQLGYGSVLQLLTDFNDVCYLHNIKGIIYVFGKADSATSHISKLVQGQQRSSKSSALSKKVPQSSNTKGLFIGEGTQKRIINLLKKHSDGIQLNNFASVYFNFYGYAINIKNRAISDVFKFLSDKVETFYVKDSLWVRLIKDKSSGRCLAQSKFVREEMHQSTITSDPKVSTMVSSCSSSDTNDPSGTNKKLERPLCQPDHLPSNILTNFKNLVLSHKKGFPLEMFLPLYKQKYGTTLDITKYGYTVLLHMVVSLREIFKVNKVSSSLVMVFPSKVLLRAEGVIPPVKEVGVPLPEVRPPVKEEISQSCKEEVNSSCPIESLLPLLDSLLRMYPTALPLKQMISIFNKEFPEHRGKLDPKRYQHHDLLSLLETVPSGHFVIDSTKSGPVISTRGLSEIFPVEKPKESVRKTPPGIVCVGEEYTPPNLQQLAEFDGFIEVSISVIYTPLIFYLNVRSTDHSEKLEELYVDMEKFYQAQEKGAYTVTEEDCQLHMPVCLCDSSDVYQRSIIVGLKESNEVRVYCVDTAEFLDAKRRDLLYLHEKFFSLPVQAIQARLFGVKSLPDGSFQPGCIERFLELTADKYLYVCVKGHTNNELIVNLIDTSGEDDAVINNILFQEKLIDFDEDALIDDFDMTDSNDCQKTLTSFDCDNFVNAKGNNDTLPESTFTPSLASVSNASSSPHSAIGDGIFTSDQFFKIYESYQPTPFPAEIPALNPGIPYMPNPPRAPSTTGLSQPSSEPGIDSGGDDDLVLHHQKILEYLERKRSGLLQKLSLDPDDKRLNEAFNKVRANIESIKSMNLDIL